VDGVRAGGRCDEHEAHRVAVDAQRKASGVSVPGGIESLLEQNRLAGRSGRGQVDCVKAQPLERDGGIGALLDGRYVAVQHVGCERRE